MRYRRALLSTFVLGSVIAATSMPSRSTEIPAPGRSPRIDAIKASGKLRVGVLNNPPVLIENTTGSGQPWDGPAWLIAERAAKELGVQVEPVRVSNETKVPILNSNGVDITITNLSPTPERLKVIDFVEYSHEAQCIYGLASNPKIANAKTVDDLNIPDVQLTYIIGTPQEQWLPMRFPKAKVSRVVTTSTTPIEEVMSGRTDAAPIQKAQWPALKRKIKGLKSLPQENDCQDSEEEASPIAVGIDKGQPVLKKWLEDIVHGMSDQLKASEAKVVQEMANR